MDINKTSKSPTADVIRLPIIALSNEDLVARLATERNGTMIVARGVFSQEYPLMFGYSQNLEELVGKVGLDIGGGYSSFTAEASKLGVNVRTVDPLFSQLSEVSTREDLAQGIKVIAEKELRDFVGKQADLKVYQDAGWMEDLPLHTINTPEKLLAVRNKVLEIFLQDFNDNDQHYIAGRLPDISHLPAENDFILVANLLGAYSAQSWCDYQFHLSSLIAMGNLLKPKAEIRLYPAASGSENLIGMPFDTPMSLSHAKGASIEEKVLRTQRCLAVDLQEYGLKLRLQPSDHHFVKGWNHTAIITKE